MPKRSYCLHHKVHESTAIADLLTGRLASKYAAEIFSNQALCSCSHDDVMKAAVSRQKSRQVH